MIFSYGFTYLISDELEELSGFVSLTLPGFEGTWVL